MVTTTRSDDRDLSGALNASTPARTARPASVSHERGCFVFVLPALVISGRVAIVPAFLTLDASMTEWDGVLTPFRIGVENDQALSDDHLCWQTIFDNGRGMVVFLTIPMALTLIAAAVLLNRRKSSAIQKIILLSPFVLSPVADTGIWFNMVLDINSGGRGCIDRNWFDITCPLGDRPRLCRPLGLTPTKRSSPHAQSYPSRC